MSALRPVAAILAVVFGFLLAPPRSEAHRSPSPMVDMINQVRKAHGVRPAHYSRNLSGSSSRFARYLVRTHQFAHRPPIRASSRFVKLGEILALTRGGEIRRHETLEAWLRSPSHRAVLLSPAFRHIGAARIHGRFEGRPALVWTVQFGR